MSYAVALNDAQQTGSKPRSGRQPPAGEARETWQELWSEIFRTQALRSMSQHSMPVSVSFAIATLPMTEIMTSSNTSNMLAALEQFFGTSATTLARMLRVSRPMVYHYRQGMEPSVENKRRLQLLASLATESEVVGRDRIEEVLRAQQPEGKTLLEFLSDDKLDLAVLRRLLWRNAQTQDQQVRVRMAAVLSETESAESRSDVMRTRHAQGKPTYIGDPAALGKLIQVRPDGTRVRGKMVRRRFVPDE